MPVRYLLCLSFLIVFTVASQAAAVKFIPPKIKAELKCQPQDEAYWYMIRADRNMASFVRYLQNFPTGCYAPIAEFQVEMLREPEPDFIPEDGIP